MDEQRLPSVELDPNELFVLLKRVEKSAKAKKDIWDIMAAATPLISGILISGIGLYFAYNNNEAQLKLQETQTIERFFPHLSGTEQEKKAAILAISSLTNTQTAAKYAELFPSEGTTSALKTIANSSNVKDQDKAVANKALVSTFHKMADDYQATQNTTQAEQAYEQALNAQEKVVGADSPELVVNLNQLVEVYKSDHKYTMAESTLKRILKIQKNNSGSHNPQFIETLNKLASIFKLEGKNDTAEHISEYANLLAQQKTIDTETTAINSVSSPKQSQSTASDTTKNTPVIAPLSETLVPSTTQAISSPQDHTESQQKATNDQAESESIGSNQKSASSLPANANM